MRRRIDELGAQEEKRKRLSDSMHVADSFRNTFAAFLLSSRHFGSSAYLRARDWPPSRPWRAHNAHKCVNIVIGDGARAREEEEQHF